MFWRPWSGEFQGDCLSCVWYRCCPDCHDRTAKRPLPLIRSRPNWITGLGPKSGSAGKSGSRGPENGVSRWRRLNSDIYSQNYHFGLVYDMKYKSLQTPQKLLTLYRNKNTFLTFFPNFQHGYIKKFNGPPIFFISRGPRTDKFRGVCLLAWRQRIISLVCFANNAIHPLPEAMPKFDRKVPPGFTPDISLSPNLVEGFVSPILQFRDSGTQSLDQNF